MTATPEQLLERWTTPLGRRVLEELLRDLQQEGGLNLPAILEPLPHSGEVPDGLDLRFAPLESQQLDGANLYGVDLTGAVLSGSSMRETDVRDAVLTGARLDGADLKGAYLSQSDLTGATLVAARLDGAMLDGANLTGASLQGASCQGGYFAQATLDGADLRQARLEGTDFSGASGLGATLSSGALERSSVPLPPGTYSVEPPPAPAPRPRIAAPRGGAGPRRATTTSPLSRPRPDGLPLTDWDQALARLITLRGRVAQVRILLDGRETLLFEEG